MDYELRIVVEKVAVGSQEVVQRDTIKRYGIQRPASIVDLGLRHAEQISLLETIHNALLVEQAALLASGGSAARLTAVLAGESPAGAIPHLAP
jgi:hypothetical protein